MTETIKVKWGRLGSEIKEYFACFPQPSVSPGYESLLLLDNQRLLQLADLLCTKYHFKTLSLINAVEYTEVVQLIYQLTCYEPEYSLFHLKVNLNKNDLQVPSVHQIWSSADWFEREIFDMHGIIFLNHPNLKRILNPEDWEGFPLRKDYIPPLDALNAPITTVKSALKTIPQHTRHQIEEIVSPPQA